MNPNFPSSRRSFLQVGTILACSSFPATSAILQATTRTASLEKLLQDYQEKTRPEFKIEKHENLLNASHTTGSDFIEARKEGNLGDEIIGSLYYLRKTKTELSAYKTDKITAQDVKDRQALAEQLSSFEKALKEHTPLITSDLELFRAEGNKLEKSAHALSARLFKNNKTAAEFDRDFTQILTLENSLTNLPQCSTPLASDLTKAESLHFSNFANALTRTRNQLAEQKINWRNGLSSTLTINPNIISDYAVLHEFVLAIKNAANLEYRKDFPKEAQEEFCRELLTVGAATYVNLISSPDPIIFTAENRLELLKTNNKVWFATEPDQHESDLTNALNQQHYKKVGIGIAFTVASIAGLLSMVGVWYKNAYHKMN